MKPRDIMALAILMGAMSGGNVDLPHPQADKIAPEEKNSNKNCFRKGCNNLRNGNKLYCSAECAKLDKKQRKS